MRWGGGGDAAGCMHHGAGFHRLPPPALLPTLSRPPAPLTAPQEFELELDVKEGAASDDEQPEQMDQD